MNFRIGDTFRVRKSLYALGEEWEKWFPRGEVFEVHRMSGENLASTENWWLPIRYCVRIWQEFYEKYKEGGIGLSALVVLLLSLAVARFIAWKRYNPN